MCAPTPHAFVTLSVHLDLPLYDSIHYRQHQKKPGPSQPLEGVYSLAAHMLVEHVQHHGGLLLLWA